MDRPTISDLARAADVSVSTVDRVLNGRDPVRKPTAARVLAAAAQIGFPLTSQVRKRLAPDRAAPVLGFLLQQKARPFYRLLAEAIVGACEGAAEPRIVHLEQLDPAHVAAEIDRLGKSVHALAIVAANHPRVSEAIERLQGRRIPVFALISELTAADRIGYVGLDNWKVGRTAAWAIAQIAKRAGEVGIIVGSHRYRCQELNEMGFRSYFREHAPDFTLLEARTSLEDARYGAEATRDLLARHPDLVGLYIAGGGVSGVMEALRENVRARIVAVGHDLTPRTREGLIDGTLELTLSHPLPALGKALVGAMAQSALGASAPASLVLPFELHTAENL